MTRDVNRKSVNRSSILKPIDWLSLLITSIQKWLNAPRRGHSMAPEVVNNQTVILSQ